MSKDEGSAATVMLAFMIGAVSGAALALLYAPATGEETRRLLKNKAREGRDLAAEALEKGREAAKEGRDVVTQAMKESRDVLSQAIERGREVYEQTRRENA